MIVVTGATGKLGGHVMRGLEQRVPATGLTALVRDPAKVTERVLGLQVRQADYTRPETLGPALRGADKVLLISSNEVGQRFRQHEEVIRAAKQEGVKLLVYTSLLHADRSPLTSLAAEHHQTEVAIRASGIPFVLLRNGWYLENYTENMSMALKQGAMIGSASGGRISAAARADYAAAAVEVLTTEGHVGQTYELAGDHSFTMHDYVRELSHQVGKPIVYNNLPPEAYTQALVEAGLPLSVAEMLTGWDVGIANGGLEDESGTLRRLIGRPTTTLAEAIAAQLPK
jgi:NAD(P)H dehydrogenase (quinone)